MKKNPEPSFVRIYLRRLCTVILGFLAFGLIVTAIVAIPEVYLMGLIVAGTLMGILGLIWVDAKREYNKRKRGDY